LATSTPKQTRHRSAMSFAAVAARRWSIAHGGSQGVGIGHGPRRTRDFLVIKNSPAPSKAVAVQKDGKPPWQGSWLASYVGQLWRATLEGACPPPRAAPGWRRPAGAGPRPPGRCRSLLAAGGRRPKAYVRFEIEPPLLTFRVRRVAIPSRLAHVGVRRAVVCAKLCATTQHGRDVSSSRRHLEVGPCPRWRDAPGRGLRPAFWPRCSRRVGEHHRAARPIKEGIRGAAVAGGIEVCCRRSHGVAQVIGGAQSG